MLRLFMLSMVFVDVVSLCCDVDCVLRCCVFCVVVGGVDVVIFVVVVDVVVLLWYCCCFRQ